MISLSAVIKSIYLGEYSRIFAHYPVGYFKKTKTKSTQKTKIFFVLFLCLISCNVEWEIRKHNFKKLREFFSFVFNKNTK